MAHAMCAIDALGIAPMLGLPIEVRSRDPISGGEVHVQLHPGEQPDWQPKKAVVLAGSTHCDGPSFGGGAAAIHAAFSPDGRLIAYASDEGRPGLFHIWLIDLESGTQPAHYFAGHAQQMLLLANTGGFGLLARVGDLWAPMLKRKFDLRSLLK